MHLTKYYLIKNKIGRLLSIIDEFGFREGLRAIGRFIKLSGFLGNLTVAHLKLRTNNGLVLRDIQGSKMYLDLSDLGLSRELILTGTHEEFTARMFRRELNKGMTVVDIGANLGYYALMEAAIVGKKGKVYAIEPIPRNFELLVRNIKANGYESIIEAYCVAVSDKSGISEIPLTKQSNWPSMLPQDLMSKYMYDKMQRTTIKLINTRTISLDEFLKDKDPVDFIRMDIEGYEVSALEGMAETLKQPHPLKLLFEVHPVCFKEPSQTIGMLVQKLVDLGFEPKAVIYGKARLFDISPDDLAEVVCNYRSPHIFLQRL